MQPIKKKTLPNIAQKFPRLDIINPIADIKNKTHPTIFTILIFIYQSICNFLFSQIHSKILNKSGNFFLSKFEINLGPISKAN